MKYTIVARDHIEDIYTETVNGERAAVNAAREMAAEHPDLQVFVRWYRQSDGQTGYLNPGGDHDITGRRW